MSRPYIIDQDTCQQDQLSTSETVVCVSVSSAHSLASQSFDASLVTGKDFHALKLTSEHRGNHLVCSSSPAAGSHFVTAQLCTGVLLSSRPQHAANIDSVMLSSSQQCSEAISLYARKHGSWQSSNRSTVT